MGTRAGIDLIESVLIQLIHGFDVNHKGRISNVHINIDEPIVLPILGEVPITFDHILDLVNSALIQRDTHVMEFSYDEFTHEELSNLQVDLHEYVSTTENVNFKYVCQLVMVTDTEKLRVTFIRLKRDD